VADEQTTLTQRWRCREDFTEAGRRVVAQAHLHAYAHHSDHVGTEHFLLALDENYEGAIADLLQRAGITRADVRRRIEQAIGPEQVPRAAHLPYSPHVKRALAYSLLDTQRRCDQLIDVEPHSTQSRDA
jgi:ATP-dependent Clp protease ATP-binding subunit ClpA